MVRMFPQRPEPEVDGRRESQGPSAPSPGHRPGLCDAQPGAQQLYFERFEKICEISVTSDTHYQVILSRLRREIRQINTNQANQF